MTRDPYRLELMIRDLQAELAGARAELVELRRLVPNYGDEPYEPAPNAHPEAETPPEAA